MRRSIAIASLGLMGWGGTVYAQPAMPMSAHLSPAFVACMQRAGAQPVQRDVCASREAGGQDDRLNKAYQQVMHQLAKDPAAHDTLRTEQRRWLHERDYTCKFNGEAVNESCVVMKTAERADELESQVHF